MICPVAECNCSRREPMSRPAHKTFVTILHNAFTFALIVAVIACLACASLMAQVTSGTIFGTVKDPSGAFVNGATVTIASPSNGITRTVTTSDNGEFAAPNLSPGTYDIAVEAKGFKRQVSTGVVLSAADKLNAGEI